MRYESDVISKNIKRNQIIDFLANNSYIKTNLVTSTGEYAVRSFIRLYKSTL